MPPTHAQRLASILLGQSVHEWIALRRPDTSYRQIAHELREATGGAVDVTGETLRGWVIEEPEKAAS